MSKIDDLRSQSQQLLADFCRNWPETDYGDGGDVEQNLALIYAVSAVLVAAGVDLKRWKPFHERAAFLAEQVGFQRTLRNAGIDAITAIRKACN